MSEVGKFKRPEHIPKGYTRKTSRWRFPHNTRPNEVIAALRVIRMEPRGFSQGARVGGTFENREDQRRAIAKEKAEALSKVRDNGATKRRVE